VMRVFRLYYTHFMSRYFWPPFARLKLWHFFVVSGGQDRDPTEMEDELNLALKSRTQTWRRRAWRHHLILPPEDSENTYWTHLYFDELGKPNQLTTAGVRYILDQYRKEIGARREAVMKWATLIFAAIAAAGALTKMFGVGALD